MVLVIASAIGGSMRLAIVMGVAGLLSLGNAITLSAQTVRQPGQLDASFQVRLGTNLDAYAASAIPKTSVASVDDKGDRFSNRLWIASLVSAAAGTSLDAVSSWGKQEGNSLLASSDGRFGGKALAIKTGSAAALIVPQIYFRKRKNLKTAFTIGNFADAAIYAALSAHNFQVRNANAH